MSLVSELKRERRQKLTEARRIFRSIDDDTPEHVARAKEKDFDALMAEVDDLDERIDEAEERGHAADPRRPVGGAVARDDRADERGEREQFIDYLRNPAVRGAPQSRAEIEARVMSGATASAGGATVPSILYEQIAQRALDENPLGGIVSRMRVRTPNVSLPVSNSDASTAWAAELDTRNETDDLSFTAKAPTMGMLYSLVTVSQELLMDSAFNMESLFVEEVGRAMGVAEMAAILAGNGTARPSGLLNVAPETGADGTRTADALRYIPTGNAAAVTADNLVDTYYSLHSGYRRRATWAMNSNTASVLRKLKTGDGDYIWQDSLREGHPTTLLGHPVVIAEGMDDIDDGNHPILFGDFRRGYALVEHEDAPMSAIADPYTTPGRVRLYVFKRIGGCVYDEHAIRAIKTAAS